MLNSAKTPIVFVHGLWLHATSWQPWIDYFNAAGYEASAPGWPGDSDTVDEARKNPDKVADFGVEKVTHHYAAIIKKMPIKPIVIGHSFGGLIIQKLLADDMAVAGVGVDAAQPKGVLPLPLIQLRTAFPVLANPFNLTKAIMLTQEQFRFGFGNAIPAEESDTLFEKWVIPSPARPLFESAFANLNPHASTHVNTANTKRGPLLLIAGGMDHTVPASIEEYTKDLYPDSVVTDVHGFPDRGHSLSIDHGWQEVADTVITWLKKQSL